MEAVYNNEVRTWAEREYAEKSRKMMDQNMDYYKYPYQYYVHPFPIYGNLWYVGDEKVSVHIIDTGDGLVMIDAGYPNQTATLVNAIWETGFSPHDIRYIIITHEHFDHFGAAAFFREMYGSKLVMSKQAADVFKNYPQRTVISETRYAWCELFEPDMTVETGDVLELGNLKMDFRVTPGHAEGVLTMFFQVFEEGKALRAAMVGGVGMFTMSTPALVTMNLPLCIRDTLKEKLIKLREEHVDICLGNHPQQNRTLEKRKQRLQQGGNPFVDQAEWLKFIDETCLRLEKLKQTDKIES